MIDSKMPLILFEISKLTYILGIITLISFIYRHLTKNFDYWSKCGISGPKPIIIFGNYFESFFKPFTYCEVEWHKKYGKLFGIFSGNNPILKVSDPELIKLILVKDFHIFHNRRYQKVNHPIVSKGLNIAIDDEWKRVRSITSPTFTSGKIRKMYPLVRHCVTDIVEALESHAKHGEEINIKDNFGRFTMDVIAKCAFATNTNSHKTRDNPFIIHAKNIFNFRVWKVLIVLLFPSFLLKLFGIKAMTDEKSNQFFINITKHIIRKRRETNEKRNDFIQLLMDAEKANESFLKNPDIDKHESHHINEGEEEIKAENKALDMKLEDKKLTENEILAQGFLFFVAGFETTAQTLALCVYELALNEEIQEKLYKEISSSVDANGEIDYESLIKLPYLDSVLSETLRKYPNSINIERVATENYILSDTGLNIKKGQSVEIPAYAIHHFEDYYPNPEKFIPERFLPENRDKIIAYTYLPFGSGPRNCIGMRFALMEAKLCLVHILQNYRFTKGSKTDVPLIYKPAIKFLLSNRIFVKIYERNK